MDFMPFGIWEIILVLVVIMLVVGPRRLPEIARTLGEIVRNIRSATTELTRNITAEIDNEVIEAKKDVDEINIEVKRTLKDAVDINNNTEDENNTNN